MTKHLLSVFTFFVSLSFVGVSYSSAWAAESGERLRVMVDAGHGGYDKGAVHNGIIESELCFKIAQDLVEDLKSDHRFEVLQTRTKDEKMTLRSRSDIAARAKIDLFLSIHANSSTDPNAYGLEIYFQNQLEPDEESMFLANIENESGEESTSNLKAKEASKGDLRGILDDLERNYNVMASHRLSQSILEQMPRNFLGRIKNHSIRQAPFHVVSQISAPSVLIEVGFLTHAQEGPRLGSREHQRQIAENIYKGLVKYKESLDKDHAKSLH